VTALFALTTLIAAVIAYHATHLPSAPDTGTSKLTS